MTPVAPRRGAAVLGLLLASGLAGTATAQDMADAPASLAYEYVLRATTGGPWRVVQGRVHTWVVPIGAPLEAGRAKFLLRGDTLLSPETNGLLLAGWPAPGDSGEIVTMELTRGSRDRLVAGRSADHYRLLATVEILDSLAGVFRSKRLDADLWILADLPFTWAPFGADTLDLPMRFPGLREALTPALDSLGLVGRGELRVDVGGGVVARRTFEISKLRRAAPPPAPGATLSRKVLADLERLLRSRPARVCRSAADGELPALVRSRVPLELWPPVIGKIAGRCREPALYVAMAEDRLAEDRLAGDQFAGDHLAEDRERLCMRVRSAWSNQELLREALTESQRAALEEHLSYRDRGAVAEAIRHRCGG